MNRLMHYVLIDHRVVECPDLMQWAKWFEMSRKDESFRVGETVIGELRISTVFLGLDHRFLSDGPPIVFETMVFQETAEEREHCGEVFDDCMQRYCTYEEAERGHEAIVDSLRALESDAVEITRGMLNIVRMGVTSTMQQWRKDHG